MDEYIKREDALDAVLFALVGTGLQSRALNAIHEVDTADVVPKSEEGAECPTCYGTGRIGTTNWLTKNISKKQLAEEKAKAIAEHEQHIKTEVAREMIQDIASECTLKKDACCNSLEFGIGYLAAMNEVLSHLAKLKKKYTEGK